MGRPLEETRKLKTYSSSSHLKREGRFRPPSRARCFCRGLRGGGAYIILDLVPVGGFEPETHHMRQRERLHQGTNQHLPSDRCCFGPQPHSSGLMAPFNMIFRKVSVLFVSNQQIGPTNHTNIVMVLYFIVG